MEDDFPETRYAWAAGIIDGEGCFTLGRYRRKTGTSPNIQTRITVGMSDCDTIKVLHGMFSGCTWTEERGSNRKTMYWWAVSSKGDVQRTLERIDPYLLTKKAQSLVMLDFFRDYSWLDGKVGGYGGQSETLKYSIKQIEIVDRLATKMKLLNLRGKAAVEYRRITYE